MSRKEDTPEAQAERREYEFEDTLRLRTRLLEENLGATGPNGAAIIKEHMESLAQHVRAVAEMHPDPGLLDSQQCPSKHPRFKVRCGLHRSHYNTGHEFFLHWWDDDDE